MGIGATSKAVERGAGARQLAKALRNSHDALMARVVQLSGAQLDAPSYCIGWNVAQVLSHMGSGAEIALTGLERALDAAPPLAHEDFPVIWGRWNALSLADKRSEMIVWDRRHVSVLQALDDEVLSSLELTMGGRKLDAATSLAYRLFEHTAHSWDVEVTFNPAAELLSSSVELLMDHLDLVIGAAAKPEHALGTLRVAVRTRTPDRAFVLSLAGTATLDRAGQADGMLDLPAASFVRLIYGRLDADHMPAEVKSEGPADLQVLRGVFPGF